MKKVLFITYYSPPLTGAAVQRAQAFCRYLPEFGFTPLVLSAYFPGGTKTFAPHHETVSGFDPASWLKKNKANASSVTGSEPAPWMEWIRLNLFIPDAKIGWRRPARRKAMELIERERPDLIFTTAPPYTVHLVGLDLKKRYGLPWVADFRDPWMENHAYNTVYRNPLAVALNRRMESAVLEQADRVTCALDSQRVLLSRKTTRPESDFTTIHNGFDPADRAPDARLVRSERFYLSHFGTVYPDGLDIDFFTALAECVKNDPTLRRDFVLRMIGVIPPPTQEALRAAWPKANLILAAPLPHADIQRLLTEQQLLLLLVNKGERHAYSHPSKVFEYMASGNPILATGPSEHEVMRIVRAHAPDRSGIMDASTDLHAFLAHWHREWMENRMPDTPVMTDAFTRRTLTRNLAALFESLTPPTPA